MTTRLFIFGPYLIPAYRRPIKAQCTSMETRKEEDCWLTSGRSEKSVIVREDLMIG
jgi:hypothetical protein